MYFSAAEFYVVPKLQRCVGFGLFTIGFLLRGSKQLPFLIDQSSKNAICGLKYAVHRWNWHISILQIDHIYSVLAYIWMYTMHERWRQTNTATCWLL